MEVNIGDLIFDTETEQLRKTNGTTVYLRAQSAKVLQLLVEHQNRVVDKSEFMKVVWGDVIVTDDSLAKCIGDIRKAIGVDGHQVIQTIPKRGYKLVASEDNGSRRLSTKHRTARAAALALFTMVFGVAIFGFVYDSLQAERSVAKSNNYKPTLFVENFETHETDTRMKRLASGLSLDIVTELSRNKWLRVHHLTEATDGNSISNPGKLFQYLLRGTMIENNNDIKLTAQLLKTDNRQVVWSKSLVSDETEFFSTEQSLIEQIGSSIGSEWNGVVARDVLVEARKRPTENLKAYEAVLLGVEHMRRFNPEESKKALSQLRYAIELDPEYGEAWAVLAKALMLDKDHASSEEERTRLVEEQKIAAAKSYEFAPYHIDSRLQYSWLMAMAGDYIRTEKYLREAAEAAINNPDILAHIAWAGSERVNLGEDAVYWARRAFDLSEAAPNWYTNALAAAQFNNGDAAEALETLKAAPDDLSRWVYEAVAAAHLGRNKLAQENTRKILDQNPAFRVGSFFKAVPMLDDEVRNRLRSAMLAAGLPQ